MAAVFPYAMAAPPDTPYRLVASFTTDPITLDGRLEEPAWEKATSADDFSAVGINAGPAQPQTSVKALTDGANLFLGFRCEEPALDSLVSTEKPRDGKVYLDDSVEVILDPTNERRFLVHLVANVRGDQFDTSGTIKGNAVAENEKWNGSWAVATSKGKDAWYAEWRIVLAELGIKPPFPATMGVNLCRNRPRDSRGYSSWSPCDMRFVEPRSLGELILPDAAGGYCFAEFPRSRVFAVGHPLPPLEVTSQFHDPVKVRIDCELEGPAGASRSGQSNVSSVGAGEQTKVECPVAPATSGPYRLFARVKSPDGARTFHVLVRDFEAMAELEITPNLSSLYSHRLEAVAQVHHPDAWRRGSALAVHLLCGDQNVRGDIITREGGLVGNTPISFDLAGLPAGTYQLKAELKRGEERLASAVSRVFAYTPNPKIGFTPDGFLKVDGQPFFPIGMYTLQSAKPPLTHDQVLAEARAAGFNTTVFYAYKLADVTPLLDAAGRNGIRAFVYAANPYKIRTGKWTPQDVEPEVKARMNHPALLGWYLFDEPEGIGETSEHTARRFYETVKGIDMDHPCSLVIMSPPAARAYADAADIVWVDPYPVPDQPVGYVAETLDGVVKAAGRDKPVWAVPQAFDWNVWRKGAIDKVHRPTDAEERCMTYLALVHGAKGIIYWAHTASKYYIRDYPEHWETMKRLAGELRTLSPVLLSTEAPPTILVLSDSDHFDGRAIKHDGSTYMLAVNRNPSSPCEVTFVLQRSAAPSSVEVLFENRTIKPEGARWHDSFDPLAVHVYRLAAK